MFYQGEQCGTIREYSDTLAIFLLKAHKSEKYRERFEHTGTGSTSLFPDPLDDAQILDTAPDSSSLIDSARRKLDAEAKGQDPWVRP